MIAEDFHTAELWFLAAAILALVLSGYRWWRLAQREAIQRSRLDAFRGSVRQGSRAAPSSAWHRQFASLIAISPVVGTVEQKRLLRLLVQAGIKGRASLANFIAIKVCGGLVFAGLAWIALEWEQIGETLVWVAALGAGLLGGWRVPDFILHRMIRQRQSRLEQGMPDAMDLLVVCSEAGLSLNQSIEEVSRQLLLSNPDAADEFATTAGEMQILPDFSKALDNMVERTGLDDLRSLVATLKQSLKFGTSLAESLRMIAGEMRAARQARMEERAARLPVLLAIPMMMFILPCLFMIVGTPVVVRIMDLFRSFTVGGL